MIRLICALLVIALTGCEVSELKKRKANFLCESHGGVYSISSIKRDYLTCNNGKIFQFEEVDRLIIPTEKLKEYLSD